MQSNMLIVINSYRAECRRVPAGRRCMTENSKYVCYMVFINSNGKALQIWNVHLLVFLIIKRSIRPVDRKTIRPLQIFPSHVCFYTPLMRPSQMLPNDLCHEGHCHYTRQLGASFDCEEQPSQDRPPNRSTHDRGYLLQRVPVLHRLLGEPQQFCHSTSGEYDHSRQYLHGDYFGSL